MLPVRLIDGLIYVTMLLSLIAAYPPKRNQKVCYLAVLPFAAAGVGLTLLEELLPSGTTLVYLSLFVIVGSAFGALFLSGRFSERLILLLMFTCTFEFCNGIMMYLDTFINGAGVIFWRWKIFDIPFVILGGYVSYRLALHTRNELPWFCWVPIILISIFSMVEHLLPIVPNGQPIPETWVRFHALSSLLRLLILYLAYFVYSRMSRYYETYLQLAVSQKIMDSQSHQVQESMRLNRELRKQRHEYNHTLTSALGLLQHGEYDQLEKLLQEQVDTDALPGDVIHSGNAVADAVLNQKAAEAKRLQIPFEADVCLSPDLPISNAEMITLLANLLDNAIEGSKTIDDPSISVHIYPTRCYLCFSVRNRANCSQLDADNLRTTKSSREAHGFGLDLIRDIARAHQGVAEFTPTAEDIFIADVTIFLGDNIPSI